MTADPCHGRASFNIAWYYNYLAWNKPWPLCFSDFEIAPEDRHKNRNYIINQWPSLLVTFKFLLITQWPWASFWVSLEF